VSLPPFLVEDQDVDYRVERPDWFYAAGDGLEILSACNEEETQEYIQELRKQRIEMGRFIPDEFLLHMSLPTTLILFPTSLRHAMDQEMVHELERIPLKFPISDRFRPMDDLRLSDPDSTYMFAALDDIEWRIRKADWKTANGRLPGFVYSPAYLEFLLESRSPALPEWYSVGIMRLYEAVRVPWEDGVFEPDKWLSVDHVSAVRTIRSAQKTLLPMGELLVARISAERPEEYRNIWRAQAELFVRWALSGKLANGRERLRRLVAVAALQPVTERQFQSCFGMDYAQAGVGLSDYLALAVKEPLKGPAAPSVALDPLELHTATKEEIRRIKGEWGRRVLAMVAKYNPDAYTLYVEQDRKLLQGAYDGGSRDPRLLASLALFRIETNDKVGARALLEANPDATAARPLASLKLAWLRLNDALPQPTAKEGMLSESQASGILQYIASSLSHQPPIKDAFTMAAVVSEHLRRDPSKIELDRLNEGARLFPRNSGLVYRTASWDLRAGAVGDARSLIGLGLSQASDASARSKLEALLAESLPQPQAQAARPPSPEPAEYAGVFGHALLVSWVRPVYPPDALKQGLGGTVTLRLLIDKKGNVQKSRVLDSTDSRFIGSAQTAVGKWQFSPAMDDSKPVAGWMDVPVIFSPSNPFFKGPSPSLPPEEQLPYQSPTTPARLDSDPDVVYPDSLFDRKLSGWARFSCVVLPDGSTAQPQILAATHVDFVLPAFNAVEHLKYLPRMNGDTPVEAEVRGELKFNVYPQDDAGALAADKITAPDGTPAAAGLRPDVVVDPVWPYDLLIGGEGGSAVVRFTVDESGAPRDVRVSAASNPSFGDSLVAAMESSSFLPPAIDGHSVKVSLIKRAEFSPIDLSAQTESNPLARLIMAIRSNKIEETRSLGSKLDPIYRLSPIYPSSLKGAGGPAGDAEIEFIIDRGGRARFPRIISATDNRFGWAAAIAVSQWVFQVPRINGQPVDVRVRIPFHFNPQTGGQSP
jgi:TonB family protein